LLTRTDGELHRLALLERTVAVHLDRGPVDEDIAVVRCGGDEAVALLRVEPLHCSLGHWHCSIHCGRRRSSVDRRRCLPGVSLALSRAADRQAHLPLPTRYNHRSIVPPPGPAACST